MSATPAEILSLIRSKNRCLDRLMQVTRDVLTLDESRWLELPKGERCTPLETYDRERIAVTRALELFDGKLNELIPQLTADQKRGLPIEEVKAEMHKNEILLHAIFSADDIVFRKLGELQKRVTVQLTENRKSRELLTKFRSQWVTEASSGESVDTTL